jgi:hypothetical protein
VKGREPEPVWVFTQHCYGEIAAINWSNLFGSEKINDHHYKKLLASIASSSVPPKFSCEAVEARLLKKIGYTDVRYKKLRTEIMSFRDKWAAHKDKDVGKTVVKFPKIAKMVIMFEELREILREIIQADLNSESLKQKFYENVTDLVYKSDNQKLNKIIKSGKTELKSLGNLFYWPVVLKK